VFHRNNHCRAVRLASRDSLFDSSILIKNRHAAALSLSLSLSLFGEMPKNLKALCNCVFVQNEWNNDRLESPRKKVHSSFNPFVSTQQENQARKEQEVKHYLNGDDYHTFFATISIHHGIIEI